MKKRSERKIIKNDIKNIHKSMDFISNRLKNKKANKRYYSIYQQLGLAWEYLGLKCKHWDGYRKIENNKSACKICGKIKGVDDSYYLFSKTGNKIIGKIIYPNSNIIHKNKKTATLLSDSITFHGAVISIDVHNAYESKLIGKHKIIIAADRIVKISEDNAECYFDKYLLHITINKAKVNKNVKKYGGFPWELKKSALKKFPVIFDYDENHNFLGLTVLK